MHIPPKVYLGQILGLVSPEPRVVQLLPINFVEMILKEGSAQ